MSERKINVLSFEAWKKKIEDDLSEEERDLKRECENCDGEGFVCLEDRAGNEYEFECKECDGEGEDIGHPEFCTRRQQYKAQLIRDLTRLEAIYGVQLISSSGRFSSSVNYIEEVAV